MKKDIRLLWVSGGILLSLTMAQPFAHAVVKKPVPLLAGAKVQKMQPAPKTAPLPANMIAAAEAMRRIEAHMKTIADRKAAMSALYDYKPSVDTMTESYRRNGASQWATDNYAANAGQNGLYLTWDVVQRFYDAHAEALKQSLWDIRMKKGATVASADLAYLDHGMAAWLSKEKEVQVRMQHYTETKGKTGAALGKSHELWEHHNDSKVENALYQEADAQYYHLNGIAGTLDTAVRDIGYKTRLFSAITASERIPVAEPPPEKIKRLPAQ